MVDSWNAAQLNEAVGNGSIGGGSSLPEVSASDNGKILMVVEGSWNKADAPIGNLNYSTSEQDTGIKWIDGSEIYQKTILLEDTYGTSGDKLVPHGISDLRLIIKSFGYLTDSTNMLPLPAYPDKDGYQYSVGVYFTPTAVRIRTGSSVSSYNSGYITLFYIKSEES